MALKNLPNSLARWRAGEIDDASFAGLYFLHWQAERHGKRFASRRNRSEPKPDTRSWFEESAALEREALRDYLAEYFVRYQFFGVALNATEALSAWLGASWALKLFERIPGSLEVLKMQVEGIRPVTLLSTWPRMLAPVLDKADAFAFMIHDLEHAWKFYHDPEMHRRQVELFRLLLTALEAGIFSRYLSDPLFAAKFDYLISDMNTHALHASQYLRAILLEFHLRRQDLRHPDCLTREAREDVAGVMASLLDAEWLAEVEKRMIVSTSSQ